MCLCLIKRFLSRHLRFEEHIHIAELNVFAGVVSCENQYPPCSGRHGEYVSSGPMCRYAEDLLPMLKIMAGPNAHM